MMTSSKESSESRPLSEEGRNVRQARGMGKIHDSSAGTLDPGADECRSRPIPTEKQW